MRKIFALRESHLVSSAYMAVAFSYAFNHQNANKMVNSIQTFASSQFGEIRTAGTPENPLFCLADLCRALGLHSNVVRQRLTEGVCSTYPLQTAGGMQQVTFVNDDGLFDVILDSRKPEARAFRKWVTSEVLPSIRRTGGYIPVDESDTEAEIMAKALIIANRTNKEREQRIQILEGENKFLLEENKTLAPKAKYTDEVLQSTSTITFSEAAKELNFRTANALTKKLISDRILYKQSGRYLPTAKYSTQGYFATRVHKFLHRDGSIGTNSLTVITEQGRLFLHNHFNIIPVVDLTNINVTLI